MGLEALGISMNSNPKIDMTGKSLLVVGSGRCVWEDLDGFNYSGYDVMCLNDMIMHFPGEVKHAYSNDHRWLPKWVAARRPRYEINFGTIPYLHTCQVGPSSMHVWNIPGHGTSGLNACYAGIGMNYARIVLAGVPLTNEGHYFDPPSGWNGREAWTNFGKEVPGVQKGLNIVPRYWEVAKSKVFEGRVKSLSGRTKELLGGP